MSAIAVLPPRRLIARTLGTPGAAAGVVILAALVLGAIFAPIFSPFDPNATRVCPRLAAPSLAHWFGCDLFGRDIFSRILYGGRLSLAIGLLTVAISLFAGTLIGMVIAFLGGRADRIGTRLLDVMLGFPPIVLAILIVAVLGVSAFNAALAVGISGIPRFARVVRSATLLLVGREFVESARAMGASQTRILRRHLLPNLMPVIIVLASLDLGTAILSTATLSFLGLGAQPPTAEWGAMLNAGREFMRYAPWTMIFPGLALFLAVMSVNLVGDRLSHILDPRAGGRV
ncbi:MAG: ABC transporter permease [Alphaproteobacteria bacterium]|nr:ABC transporter permease [Alphaproteobacteria bacterium]